MNKIKSVTFFMAIALCVCSCNVSMTDTQNTKEETSSIYDSESSSDFDMETIDAETIDVETTDIETQTTELPNIEPTETEETTDIETTTESTTEIATTDESETSSEEQSFEEEHSSLYIEGYTVEDVIQYFCEVVLNSEYYTGEGDFTLVQKWIKPIRYSIFGEATQADREKLLSLFEKLNKIEGFPGIALATENEITNLWLYFQDYENFYLNFGGIVNYEAVDGAVEYWYFNEINEIYNARIGYRTDIDQSIRNAVLLEEVVNGLGLGTDTILREDSIIYQGFNEVQDLSEMDWLIIQLLYHPEMKCGMNQEQCSEVIRKLYY